MKKTGEFEYNKCQVEQGVMGACEELPNLAVGRLLRGGELDLTGSVEGSRVNWIG